MTRPRRIFIILLVVLLLAVPLLVIAMWRRPREAGMNPLEQWCADQLRRIAGDLLVPELQFSALQLELPVTVTLSDVSLTSDGTAIIAMSSMRLEFRELPKRGQPLVIEAATFVEPKVRLIGRDDGTLQGFDGFTKSTTGKQYEDGGSSRPSDFLAIRRIAIRDGMLEWARAGHEHPMEFSQLDMDLSTSPDADKPGWYGLQANISRAPVVQLDFKGGISIDTGDLAFDDTTLKVDLTEDKYSALTPSVQDLLRRNSIAGELEMHATGVLPLNDTEATDLTIDMSLHDAGATVGDYQFPIETADMKATLREMRFAYDPLSVSAFHGQIDATGSMGVDGEGPFALTVHVNDVLIQNMLRPAEGETPELAGRVGLRLAVTGERRGLDTTVNGTGILTIDEGRLISIPVVGAMADVLNVAGKEEGGEDRGEIDFALSHDRATIIKSAIQSKLIAAHGTGDIHYDGRLDLTVNAGVFEKGQELLGKLGDVLGALTDRLVPYDVSGTWSEPVVKPKPLGITLGGGREKGR